MLIVADNNPTRHIKLPYVNWAIMVACIVLYAIQVPVTIFAFTPNALQYVVETGFDAPQTVPTLGSMVSYAFFHGTPLHLAGNLLALWVFGDNIEDSMGHWRYGLFFALCAMGGALAELWSPMPYVPVIGASGAIAGVMGAYLLLHPRARVVVLVAFRVPVLVPAGIIVGLSVALDLASAVTGAQTGETLIAFRAHLGGFVTGALLILVMRYRDVPLFQSNTAYPGQMLWGLDRFMIKIGGPGSSSPFSPIFWVKALVFFLLISAASEWLFGMVPL